MTPFINDDFMLYNDTGKKIYHEYAAKQPIIDFHNHLNPREIYEDKCYSNISEIWLGGDHYKWRAMRANGIPEELITGNGDPYAKFLAYADTIDNAIGNPLYHWTHLELKRYFDIDQTLSIETAKEIYDRCNAKLQTSEYSVRNLLRMQKVEVLCTTDNPVDDLKWHKKIKEEGFETTVIPSFRPGDALDIEKPGYAAYMERLSAVAGKDINSANDLIAVLTERLDYFVENGCHVTDHSLENDFFRDTTDAEVESIFLKKMKGNQLSNDECAAYKGWLLVHLGREYAKRGLVMQLHIGAIRNNSARMFKNLGADAGLDSLNDFNYAVQLSALLSAMDATNELPRTILYYLNPKDAEMLAAMAGNFQSNSERIKGKVQLGAAWWFCDHANGMSHQMDSLADVGMLSTFVGMLTDSRSFLSFPRHEYFRRILCNKIGDYAEKGQYPNDVEKLGKFAADISYFNAKSYFNF